MTLDHERRGDKSVQSNDFQSLPIYSFPTKSPPVVFGRPQQKCSVTINHGNHFYL